MNGYSDEERDRRYAVMRDRKKQLETQYGILWIAVFLAHALMLYIGLDNSRGTTAFVIATSFLTASTVCQFCGLYRKERRETIIGAGAAAVSYVCGMFSVPSAVMLTYILSILPMAGVIAWTMRVHKKWEDLSEQEGFPLFKVSLNQTGQRAKTAEQITKRAAIAEGVRSDASPNAGDMQDLLDTGAQAAAAELTGYHDRSRHVSGVQSQRTISSGDMDEI